MGGKKKIFFQWQKQAPTPTFFQYKQHRKGSGTLQPCFQYHLQNLENLLPGCSWKSYWDKDEKVQAEAEHTTCTRLSSIQIYEEWVSDTEILTNPILFKLYMLEFYCK